ncbi:MAG TPA: AAA family ATPase [Candidatus Kapabacteria bacterium]|nr:AAA family ATPase [Candidatus Kapabacteria bacterium]
MPNARVDFLNHGTLPFVERREEIDRIVRFWEGTPDSNGLRAMLVAGEAGIGKSRLLEESLARIGSRGGAVIHIRLYPDSATSLAPLIARSIWDSGAGRHLLKGEPEGRLLPVLAALRRLCRLRPTLLVIEDLHLLAGDALGELAALLESLADESIALLCAARPVDDRARGLLERFLVDELRLHGIAMEGIAELWSSLFNTVLDEEHARLLHSTTLGNALALRSAIRGAINAGAVAAGDGEAGHVRLPAAGFRAVVERHVRFLADGLAAHLTQEELNAAERLAVLGEIFARDAAAAVLGNAAAMLSVLSFKGIIAGSPTARRPLSGGEGAASLLAFTHTLLHRQLAERRSLEVETIAQLIAARLPLHSTLPVQILAECNAAPLPPELAAEVVAQLVRAAEGLQTTADWELGLRLLDAAAALFSGTREGVSPDSSRALDAALTACRLEFLARDVAGPEHAALRNRLMELTANLESRQFAVHRLRALQHQLWESIRRHGTYPERELAQFDEVMERYPELAGSPVAVDFLAVVARLSPTGPHEDLGREVEARMDAIIAAGDAAAGARAYRKIGANLLWLFDTPEELGRRLEFLRQFDPAQNVDDLDVLTWGTLLYDKIGELDTACLWAERVVDRARIRGQAHIQRTFRMIPLWAAAARGAELATVEEKAGAIIAEAPAHAAERLQRNAGARLAEIAILRGEADAARRIAATMLGGRGAWYAQQAMLLIMHGDREGALQEIAANDGAPRELRAMAEALTAGTPDAATVEALWEMMHEPILQLPAVMAHTIGVELMRMAAERPGLAPQAAARCTQLQQPIERMLDWLAERSLVAYMAALLNRCGDLIPPEARHRWQTLHASLQRAYELKESSNADVPDAPLRISMLGVIGVSRPGEGPLPLRGERLRTFLGLLVANSISARPLSYREFCHVASGGEPDQERARKAMNLAVHRLRDAIGRDAIRTEEPVPALNLARVQVDLLDAYRAMAEARAATNDRQLIRARSALMLAMEISRGEVPFPGLYDRFFEAAREDFEHTLRGLLVDIAVRLLREEDAENAADLLRAGLQALPGDGEIGELLHDALLAAGEHLEAARMRINNEA